MERRRAVNKTHLGYNVKRIRGIIGVKQEVLAERMGLSQQSVSKLENRENLDNETVTKVAKALNIPSEAILNFTNENAIHIISGAFTSIKQVDNNGSAERTQFSNPIEQIVHLYNEKIELYERIIIAEQRKVALLEELIIREAKDCFM